MLPGILNAELRSIIRDRLEYITGYSDIHKEHIDKVIFVSDAGQNSTTDEDQSVGGAESEEYGIKGNINSNAEKEQRDSDGSEDWDEEKDIMAFIDGEDLEFLENLNHVNRLKIFDAVNKLPQFPDYQSKSSMETLSEIVVKSVGLMRILNNKKKLPEREVEQFEDLLTDICVSIKCEEWIQKSEKCFARAPQSPKDAVKHDVPKKDVTPSSKTDSDAHDVQPNDATPFPKPDSDACDVRGKGKINKETVDDVLRGKEVIAEQTTHANVENCHNSTKKTNEEESPSHFLCKTDAPIKINTPVKHDILREAVSSLIEENLETSGAPEQIDNQLSPPSFSDGR